VRISLDAATEETYTSVRRVHRSHWEKAQQAVRNLRQAKDYLASDITIGVGFVVTPDNWREVMGATKLAKDLGADNIRISAMFSNEDEQLFKDFHAEAAALCAGAEVYTDKNFTVYNRFGDRLADLKWKNPEDKLCGYQFFTTYIGADLNVYRCCGYAYNDRGYLGSIANQSFKKFWLTKERFDNQWNFDGRGCERCQFRKINSALAYVLEPARQTHEEFV
jgi:radical SAM protein with 4Fe4S-binding SPASM domain